MKKALYLPLLLLLSVTRLDAQQFLPLSAVNQLKFTKTYVGLSGQAAERLHLVNLLEKHWTFTELAGGVPIDAALAGATRDDDVSALIIQVVSVASDQTTRILGQSQFGNTGVNVGEQLRLTLTGGRAFTHFAYIDLPLSAERTLRAADLAYAIINLNDRLERRFAGQKQSRRQDKKIMETRRAAANGKILYVREDLLDEESTNQLNFQNELGMHLVRVDDVKWAEIVYNQEEGAVYHVMPFEETSGRSIPAHHLVDAKTGFIIASVTFHLPPEQAGPPRREVIHEKLDREVVKRFARILK